MILSGAYMNTSSISTRVVLLPSIMLIASFILKKPPAHGLPSNGKSKLKVGIEQRKIN